MDNEQTPGQISLFPTESECAPHRGNEMGIDTALFLLRGIQDEIEAEYGKESEQAAAIQICIDASKKAKPIYLPFRRLEFDNKDYGACPCSPQHFVNLTNEDRYCQYCGQRLSLRKRKKSK